MFYEAGDNGWLVNVHLTSDFPLRIIAIEQKVGDYQNKRVNV